MKYSHTDAQGASLISGTSSGVIRHREIRETSLTLGEMFFAFGEGRATFQDVLRAQADLDLAKKPVSRRGRVL